MPRILVGGAIALTLSCAGCGRVDVAEENRRFGEAVRALAGVDAVLPAGADEGPGDDAATKPPRAGTGGLTEDAAVRRALRSHPSVRAALARVGAAKADLVQAGLLPNPSLGGNIVFSPGSPFLFDVDLMQTVLLPAVLRARSEAARAGLERTLLEQADELAADVAEVRRTWHRLADAERVLALLSESEDLARRSVASAEARRDAGQATAVDVNLAGAQVLQLQAERIAAEGRRDGMRIELATRMGVTRWGTGWTVAPVDDQPPTLPAEDAVAEVALRSRADVGLADQRVLQAEADLAAARALQWPSPQIGPNVNRQPPVYFGPALSIELPVFDQGLPRIARAGFVLAEARRQREAVALLVRRETGVARTALAAARRQVELLADRIVPAAARNLDLAEQSRNAGQVSTSVVLAAQADLLAARRKLLAARLEMRLAAVDLDRAAGARVTAAVSSPPLPP